MQDLVNFGQQNIVLLAIFTALLVAIVSMEFKRLIKKYKDIGPAEMVNLMNRDDAVVLDFRDRAEAATGTIQGAQPIAPESLVQQMDKLAVNKQAPVIGFCSQGIKAPPLCQKLAKQGFLKVYHLKGGIAAWKQANMPVVSG